MQLLTEIITELSGNQPSLIDALIKTKVLLHRLGRKDLVEWVNDEINGYPDNTTVPAYRIVPGHVKGNVTNNVYSYNDHPLPTMHLTEQQRRSLEQLEMRDSIAVLEGLAKSEKKGLQWPVPIEYCPLFSKALSGGYLVQQAWCDIGVGRMAQILTQVRSRLLDFLLELNEKVGIEMSEEEAKQVAQLPEMGSMFNNAIFGDNVTIVVGNKNQQSISNHRKKGDFSDLASFLKEKNITDEDIGALKIAIVSDEQCAEVSAKNLGPNVKGWIKTMVGKAIDATWNVEMGIAASLLANALQKYYGW